MNPRARLTWTAAILALLCACATPPPIRYYRLDALEGGPSPARTAAMPVLAIGPLSFPDYLERPQMVLTGDGAGIHLDDFHRWAEPLDEAVPRVVALNVSALVDDVTVVPGGRRRVDPDYRLLGTIHRLDPDPAGHVELLVQWEIRDAEGSMLRPPRLDRYRTGPDSPADSPGAMAAAVSDLLARFGRDIAGAMAELP